jgi:hypothetical protein
MKEQGYQNLKTVKWGDKANKKIIHSQTTI